MQKTILCIDNDPGMVATCGAILENHGYHALLACDGHYGLYLLERHGVDALLLDYGMPEMDGEAVVNEIVRRELDVPVILMTGNDDIPSELIGRVRLLVEKPVQAAELLVNLESVTTVPGNENETRSYEPRT
jgi:two-component system OmpR family response regulator